MNTDFEKLARRAIACKKWRWLPGMAVMRRDTDDIVDADSGMSFVITEVRVTAAAFEFCEPKHHFVDVSTLLNDKTRSVGSMFTKDLLPDLTDPATLGCLLALVREAWHTDSWHTRLGVDGWEVRDTYITEVDGKPTTIVCGMDWKSRGGSIDPNGSYGSEIEALVVALEAANGY